MPEGHTLHRLARDLGDAFQGDVVVSTSPQGRFEEAAARVSDRRLAAAEAYGKHLFVEFDDLPEQVHVHLGLYGKFAISTDVSRPVQGQVRWRLVSSRSLADLRGATACELLLPTEVDSVLARLGPDPLRKDADPDLGWQQIHRTRTSMAVLLMDQRVLAGVGNVYRAEVLFRHRIDPFMEGRFLRRAEWQAIWDDLVVLMHEGVESRRIDTVRAEDAADGVARVRPRRGGEVYVYRRNGERCFVCGTLVRTAVVAGRNLFWCPTCQRRSRRTTVARG